MIGYLVDNLRAGPMRTNRGVKAGAFAFLLAAAVLLPTVSQAKPISAEVARKCKILRAKEFPPRQIGNPAAGSAAGTGQDQRKFFRRCVANGGNMDSPPERK
jgi:hypothetical protein